MLSKIKPDPKQGTPMCKIWIIAFLFFTPLIGQAMSLNEINLQASASAEAPNDHMTAELAIDEQGPDASVLAHKTNQIIQSALSIIKQYPQIQASSGAYNTFPVYSSSSNDSPPALQAWRLHQTLVLQSSDFLAMQSLIGKLQNSLTLSRIDFNLSAPTLLRLSNSVTKAAIKAFRNRADLVAKSFGAHGYVLHTLTIDNGIEQPPKPFLAEAFMASKSVPTFKPGQNKVKVTVRGSIILNGVPITSFP